MLAQHPPLFPRFKPGAHSGRKCTVVILGTGCSNLFLSCQVAKKYVALKHPEVVSGRLSADEIFFSFFDGFRKLCATIDGYITLDMFEDYYKVVSASFPDDNYFRILMWSVWELAGKQESR